jgi:DNA mismatch repair ATPase MutS
MCGVPYHAADGYIARLLKKGYKVAICDQVEAPQKGVKLVKREVTRVITPGTVTDTNVLSAGKNNFLLAINEADDQRGCAFLDISTVNPCVTVLESMDGTSCCSTSNAFLRRSSVSRKAEGPRVTPKTSQEHQWMICSIWTMHRGIPSNGTATLDID